MQRMVFKIGQLIGSTLHNI